MILDFEIQNLGFTKVDKWSTDITNSYSYIVKRPDKGRNVSNNYRIDRLIGTNYMEFSSTLQRETDFAMRTFGFNGEIDNIDALFNLIENAREHNRHI